MANTLYPKFKETMLGAGGNLATGTVKAVLVDLGGYTYAAGHQFLSSVPSAARIGTPQTLLNRTVTGGAFDADDVTFPKVAAGTGTASAAEAILVYVEGASDAASPLVALLDSATGLPVTPNGGDITITWNATGIFAIGA